MRLFGVPYQRRQVNYLIGDLVIALISIQVAHWLRFGLQAPNTDLLSVLQQHTGASLFFISSMLLGLYLSDAYNGAIDFRRRSELVRPWTAVILAFITQLVAFTVFPHGWWGRGVAGLSSLMAAVLLTGWRPFVCAVSPHAAFRLKTLVVGAGQAGHLIAGTIRQHNDIDGVYDLVGLVNHPRLGNRRQTDYADDDITGPILGPPVVGSVSELSVLVKQHNVQLVIVALRGSMSSELARQLLECKANGVQIEDMPTIYKRLTGKVPILNLPDTWLIFGPVFAGTSAFAAGMQRLVDVIVSLIGATLTLPIVAVAALCVVLESKGPAFFLQERLGRNERPFRIIKLRTMRTDAEAAGPQWSQKGDTRVTRFGRFLRRSRIDELPQFWNVLLGDMSIVGPRPEREFFVNQLKERIPFYALRFSVKPGVTGWAQVKYGYGATEGDAAEKLCYELYAVQEMSPMLYMLILLKTIQTVLLRRGS